MPVGGRNKKMSYDLCIFDLDGTLTDPKLGITRSFQYALASFGIHAELDSLIKFIGPPLRDSFRISYGFSDDDTEQAVVKFREYYAETGVFENFVYPDIPDLLQKLKDSGKTLAVATNKVYLYTDKILGHFDLNRYFSFVSGDDMDGSLTKNGKRDIINIALDALDPERKMPAVMISDRELDIFGARDVGIDSIGNTWGYGSRSELEAAGATWIVDNADEVYNLIVI